MRQLLKIIWMLLLVSLNGCGNYQEEHSKERADSLNQSRVEEAEQMGTTTSFDEQDASFVVDAVNLSMVQEGIGNLAEQRASEEVIKTFGKDILRDFSEVHVKLNRFAKTERISVPLVLGDEGNQLLKELSNKSGMLFDQAFMKAESKILQRNYQKFDRLRNTVQHVELKKIIENALPMIKDRLSYVEALDEQLSNNNKEKNK